LLPHVDKIFLIITLPFPFFLIKQQVKPSNSNNNERGENVMHTGRGDYEQDIPDQGKESNA